MKATWTIRALTAVFAALLLGSSVFAANVSNVRVANNVGACDGGCGRTVNETVLEPYPAYQPLEVCDDVCIFY